MPHGTGAPLGEYSTVVPQDAQQSAQAVADVLRGARSVLVMGHRAGDGDVIGSSLGLAAALRERGIAATVFNDVPYDTRFSWLAGFDEVVQSLPDDARFDATVVVDAADPARCGTGLLPPDRRGTFVWIDHHRIDVPPGDVNYIDLTAAAVGEQIAEVLDVLGHPISARVADCLYVSLLSDTGGFRYGNTSARAFMLASRLVAAGVSPWEMTTRVFESQDEAKVRLTARALESLWRSDCGRIGVLAVRRSDLEECGASDAHVHGIVNQVRAINGVEVALLVHERPAGCQVVMRGKGNVACDEIAERLGGTGSANAARVDLSEGVDAAVEAVKKAALDTVE